MKKYFIKTFLAFIFFLLLTTYYLLPVYAHGGFEKNANNTVVYITQNPTSPLVGEKIDFTFQFRDPTVVVAKDLSVQNLANIPVEITIVDTVHGDESKDKVISEKTYTTDENGNINLSYTFPKENYFDIEFEYKDHLGKIQQTGFLVQPRALKKEVKTKEIGSREIIISMLLIGFVTGIILGRRMRKVI